jgi:hypothetical protein
MGSVIAFPATRSSRVILGAVSRIEDLPDGKKALVISARGDGFVVTMEPAINPRERAVEMFCDSHQDARRYAALTHLRVPALYQLIVDRTGEAL